MSVLLVNVFKFEFTNSYETYEKNEIVGENVNKLVIVCLFCISKMWFYVKYIRTTLKVTSWNLYLIFHFTRTGIEPTTICTHIEVMLITTLSTQSHNEDEMYSILK
jgi:hypothetical protein